ncbi:MAG: hypothetical protein IT448_09975 [Phycisphaerales bacterium]|nr:hypothetical protein [Phycisphaerales bacterium]
MISVIPILAAGDDSSIKVIAGVIAVALWIISSIASSTKKKPKQTAGRDGATQSDQPPKPPIPQPPMRAEYRHEPPPPGPYQRPTPVPTSDPAAARNRKIQQPPDINAPTSASRPEMTPRQQRRAATASSRSQKAAQRQQQQQPQRRQPTPPLPPAIAPAPTVTPAVQSATGSVHRLLTAGQLRQQIITMEILRPPLALRTDEELF